MGVGIALKLAFYLVLLYLIVFSCEKTERLIRNGSPQRVTLWGRFVIRYTDLPFAIVYAAMFYVGSRAIFDEVLTALGTQDYSAQVQASAAGMFLAWGVLLLAYVWIVIRIVRNRMPLWRRMWRA